MIAQVLNVFNRIPTKSIYDTRLFYSGKPRINRDSCAADPKKAWSHEQFPIGVPLALSHKLNPASRYSLGESPPETKRYLNHSTQHEYQMSPPPPMTREGLSNSE